MRPNTRLVVTTLLLSFGLPSLYGVGCEEQTVDYAIITSPVHQSTIAESGLFTATVGFQSPLTASSYVRMEVESGAGAVNADVTSLFLPPGQSDFDGATNVSANLDAVSLGLIPGAQTFLVRLDIDGAGGVGVRLVNFTWSPVAPGFCEDTASAALSQCFVDVSSATEQCYANTGSACRPQAAELVAARDQLTTSVLGDCDDATVQSLGYGSGLTAQGLADRLIEECEGNPASLAARAFGGPHAKVLASVPAGATCLQGVYSESAAFVDYAFTAQRDCALDSQACVNLDTDISAAEAQAVANITTACGAPDFMEFLIGILPDEALLRARRQSECMAAAALGDTSALTLDCGPRPAITVPARGVATQIILDNNEWGTRCGDGSQYAFWIRLAPAGQPLEKVVVHLQGGGVCLFDGDCANTAQNNPGRFTATDKTFPEPNESAGYQNFNDPDNPFKDWTMVYLPYCTQDIFAGGGSTEVFPNVTVERYGAINLRQTLRYFSDVMSTALEDTSEGYRPDRLTVLLGGTSAGGFGAQNNAVHFALDDLRWANTTFAPNGSLVLAGGAQSLPGLFTLKAPVDVWNLLPYFTNYCLDPECLLGENLFPAHAERLGATPHQQLLHLSGQWDNVQVGTTYFNSAEDWINSGRQTYCALESTPFNHYFYPANNSPIHNMTPSDTQFQTLTSDGIVLKDWLENAMADPASVTDAVEEGTLTTVFPTVAPFTCTVSP